jgi:hypothetical protein
MNAPHVWSTGAACLGNAAELISVLMTKKEYLAVITSTIAFIEEVNLEDRAGAYINRWPEAKKTKIKPEPKGVPCT